MVVVFQDRFHCILASAIPPCVLYKPRMWTIPHCYRILSPDPVFSLLCSVCYRLAEISLSAWRGTAWSASCYRSKTDTTGTSCWTARDTLYISVCGTEREREWLFLSVSCSQINTKLLLTYFGLTKCVLNLVFVHCIHKAR